jgi:hypothetical protein
MATLDSVLNWLVPTILILIVIGFLWIKTPLGELLTRFWHWAKEQMQGNPNADNNKNRIIVYE